MTVREIEIHPGHWKHTGSGANGIISEVVEARKVAKRVYEILKENNIPVTYFEDNTSTNQKQNLNTLINHHNKDRDGLIVSIHFNSSGATTNQGIGTEVFYYTEKSLASKVSKAISDATGGELKNRGAKQNKSLAILAKTYEPAILIEVCFVNSRKDVAVYKRDFENICQAIARELALFLGKTIGNNSNKNKPKVIYFYTGGYRGQGLAKIHEFLLYNKYWYRPLRLSDGSMAFEIGGFTVGGETYNKMKKFLDDNKFWYQINDNLK